MANGQGLGDAVLNAGDRAAAVAAVKATLRVTSGEDDALIGALADAALALAEDFIGQVLVARTLTLTLRAETGWRRIAATPVSAITSVGALDAAGTPFALGGEDYAIDIDADGDGWVRCGPSANAAALTVTCAAGLAADWASLPAPIRQGVVLLAAYLYDNRDGGDAPPVAVTALWRPFRRMRLADRAPA